MLVSKRGKDEWTGVSHFLLSLGGCCRTHLHLYKCFSSPNSREDPFALTRITLTLVQAKGGVGSFNPIVEMVSGS